MAKKPTKAMAGSKPAASNKAAGKEPRLRQEHAKAVTALAYSPDGQLLASGSADTTARLWETDTEASVGILTGCRWGVRSVAFTPAGKIGCRS